MLERGPELAAAAHAVEELVAGAAEGEPARGGVLVYRGDAGVGKTALLAEIHRTAQDRCTILTARGGETLTSVPFHLTRQLLQPALDGYGAEELNRLFGDHFDLLAPALGLASPFASSEEPADPQGVRIGLAALLGRLADRLRHKPPVLLVDDAHWADAETLAWLDVFTRTRRGRRLPALVVLAHRPVTEDDRTAEASGSPAPSGTPVTPDTTGRDQRTALLAAFAQRAHRTLGLDVLTYEATAELAREALGAHADEPFCRELWRVTTGNPYETVELLAKARDRMLEPVAGSASLLEGLGAGAKGGGLVARLQDLGPAPTRLAYGIAILGADSTPELLALLTGMRPAEVAEYTQVLRDARIVAAAPPHRRGAGAAHLSLVPHQADGRPASPPLEFTHPLVATAVYGSMSQAARTAMHGQAAWILESAKYGAAAISRHLLEVHPDDDRNVVQRLRDAAREHLAVGAPDAARRCLERAIDEPPGADAYAQVLYELGCASLLTAPAATVLHLRSALAMPGLGDDLRTDATYRLAQALAHNNQLQDAADALAAEIERTPPGIDRRRLQAAHFMYEGFVATEEDGPARSARLAELTAGFTGGENSERALITVRGFDAMLRGEPADEVVRLCDRALVGGLPARGLGWTDTAWGFEIPALTGIAYAFADRTDRAEALFTEAVRAYEISGWSGAHLAFARALLGLVHRRKGDLPGAQHHLEEALRLADRVGDGLPVHWDTVCLLVDTLLARGEVAKAREFADKYSFGPPWPGAIVLPDGPSVLGKLLLAEGRVEEAVRTLEAAADALTVRGRHHVVWAPWPFDLARALAPTDPERAARIAAEARVHAEHLGTPTALGEALRCQALFADPAEARRLLTEAVAHLAASPSRYEEARAQYDLALATGDPAAFERAAALATTCGADALAEAAVTARASSRPQE
ncbi:AAA family ATPase [Streptomyces sp. NPDC020807]|uniref:AAA family ATPase n=1 Tax=Streptomyces sp. NPDC020807 TaxID=3155119 RepID=UPI0033FCD333